MIRIRTWIRGMTRLQTRRVKSSQLVRVLRNLMKKTYQVRSACEILRNLMTQTYIPSSVNV